MDRYKVCPTCEEKNASNANFCFKCGQDISNVSVEVEDIIEATVIETKTSLRRIEEDGFLDTFMGGIFKRYKR